MNDDFLGAVSVHHLLEALEGVTYVTDTDGVIRVLGLSAWCDFAAANDAPELAPIGVIGTSLFDMISGEDVRDAYRAMHQAVVTGARPRACFTFRCDSPDVERWMRMSISLVRGEGDVGVLYQSQLIRSEVRPSVALFSRELLLQGLRGEAGRPIVAICSYCQRVAEGQGGGRWWMDAASYYRRGGGSQVRVSHGVCDACMANVVEPNTAPLPA
ncbi:MAG TPA: hypothetical protein VF699_00995 [Caulobacteraceae bacterium]|jgi:hypothetical protein